MIGDIRFDSWIYHLCRLSSPSRRFWRFQEAATPDVQWLRKCIQVSYRLLSSDGLRVIIARSLCSALPRGDQLQRAERRGNHRAFRHQAQEGGLAEDYHFISMAGLCWAWSFDHRPVLVLLLFPFRSNKTRLSWTSIRRRPPKSRRKRAALVSFCSPAC